MKARLPAKRPIGRPSNKTAENCRKLLEVIRTGLPLKFAAASVGIGYDALNLWREKDPEFSKEVELARLASVKERWDAIQAAAKGNAGTPGDWHAAAWSVERTWPADFGKPEIQLNVQNNLAVSQNGGGGITLESLVIGDLEYAKLRENQNYEHHAAGHPVRDVEAEVSQVDPDLSGHLSRRDHPGSVISESQQRANEERSRRASAKIAALLEAKRAAGSTGNGDDDTALPQAMILAMITMPQDDPPSAQWWAQLSVGTGERPITPEAATFIIKTIAMDCLGAQRASGLKIDLDDGALALRDVWAAIESLCGASGWTALVRRGEA